MKLMLKSLLFCCLLVLVFGNSTKAQDVGIVKFMVDVDNSYFEIELNDTFLLKRYRDTLPTGQYSGKVWSPGYVVQPISFTISKDLTTEVNVNMVKNNDYIQYELDYKNYRNAFHKHYTVPIALSLASTLSTGFFMVRTYGLKKQLNEDIDLYGKSPVTNELEAIKLRVSENNKKYNFSRTAFYLNGGITLGLIGGTIWAIRQFNKNYTEPVFMKDSPFKDKYSLEFKPSGCSLVFHI